MVVLRLSMQQMKEEAAKPPLAVTAPELPNQKTPIRYRLKLPINFSQLNERPYLLICDFKPLNYPQPPLKLYLPVHVPSPLPLPLLSLPFSFACLSVRCKTLRSYVTLAATFEANTNLAFTLSFSLCLCLFHWRLFQFPVRPGPS